MDLKVRRATINDLTEIQRLNHDLFLHDHKFDPALNNHWPLSKNGEKYFRQAITNNKYLALVAQSEKKIVGYLVGLIWNPWPSRPVKTAELDNMLVVPNFRGKGVGTTLVNEFIKWCKKRGIKSVVVMAYTGNRRALNFYCQHKFSDLSFRLERKL